MSVAIADTDLAAAAKLVKPAILYADRVTVHSPAAAMLQTIRTLSHVTDPSDRAVLLFDVLARVPSLRDRLDIDPEKYDTLRNLVAMRGNSRRALLRLAGATRDQTAALDEAVVALEGITGQLDDVVANSIAVIGGGELARACDAKAVFVTDLVSGRGDEAIADALNHAVGDPDPFSTETLLNAFLTRLRGIVTDPKAFPLLDGSSADLVRTLEAEGGITLNERAMRHGAEVHVAAGCMGFLPSFADLPMDEVLDLRSVLKEPLTRFRVEMGRLARDMASRPCDSDLEAEIADVWRLRIEPSLRALREALAENGLLRTTASIAAGDFKALAAEAGGAVTLGHADVLSMFLSAATAVALPGAHVATKAAWKTLSARKDARRHSLYFLHKLDRESQQSSSLTPGSLDPESCGVRTADLVEPRLHRRRPVRSTVEREPL